MEEIKTGNHPKSNAKRISFLLKKKRKFMRQLLEPIPVKEPVLLLMRRDRKVTYYEGATKGEFTFEHSDGDQRTIFLTENQYEMRIGHKDVKVYMCHEDYPMPLPSSNMKLGELFQMQLDKALYDVRNLKIKEEEAKAGKIMTWFQGVAILGIIYIIYILLKPDDPTPIIEGASQVAQNINTNASISDRLPTILR